MKSYFHLLLLVLVCFTELSAQCGITVDAGPDLFYCPGGGQVQLNGTVSGANIAGFSWDPTTGLNDPNSLNPIATVSGPTTYTLTAEVFDPTANVIINGDFSSGDIGFTTDYDMASGGSFGPLSNEGEYMVSTNSSLTHNNFSNCTDHTGGGNMMVVNGSAIPDERVWCQTVAVVPNTLYSFNAWLMSAHPSNPARLQFSVNGSLLGSEFRASSTTCNWQQFSETWNSGPATSVEICITNQNTQPSGNDFAIDDIFFGEICTQSDNVFIDEVFLEAFADSPVDLPCTGGTLMLDGSGTTTGPSYFYDWSTTNGNIVSGGTTLFPTVNQEGTYVLTVLFDDGVAFCTQQAFVVVNANNNIPTAVAGIFLPLDCNNPFAVLVADGSTTGPDIDYQWTTTDGNIISNPNSDQINIDQPGTYRLMVTNVDGNCSDQTTITVTGDLDPPVASIQPPGSLTCTTTSLALNGSGSSTDGSFDVVWSTTDGNIVSGSNQFNPLIDQPGTYVLTLTNQGNGCSTSQSVTVTENMPILSAAIETGGTLDCNTTQLNLDARNSTAPAGSTYQWSTMDGNIVSGGNTSQPLIDAPGTYILLLTDPASGCESSAFVSVQRTAARPDIALQGPPPFTCVRAQITLDATASSTGSDYQYTWSAANGGGIVADTNSLTPTVAGPGDYTLSIVNTTNGCRRDTTFSIGENTSPPLADAGASFTLSCSSPTDTLNGLGSSQGTNFTYRWTSADGTLTGGTTTLRPEINNAGTYQLVVADTLNGCTDTARVTVLQDNNAPVVTIAPPADLTCSQTTLMLDASGSATGPGLTTDWSTTDGNFTGGTNGLTPSIDQPGTYLLTITDQANGCPTTRSVTVTEDIVAPAPDAGPALTLTCFNPTGRLSALDPGPGFSVAWSGASTVTDPNTTTPLVSASGRYYFVVTDLNNGCMATDSVEVAVDQTPPALALNPGTELLTCTDTSLLLNPGATAVNGLSYAWSTTDGNVTSPDTLPEVRVNQPGNYTLLVTDTTNGCTNAAALIISRDVTLPNVEILPPAILNCALTQTTLSPGSSDVGTTFMVSWATADGLLLPGSGAGDAVAGQGGTYQLTITNTLNGCVDSTSVLVVQDTVRPVAGVAPPALLTCLEPQQNLDGSASSQGLGFSYSWASPDGNITGSNDQLTAAINAAGRYRLTVTDTNNFCVATDSVQVMSNQVAPSVDAGTDQLITCRDTVAFLGAAAGAGNGLSYAWTALSGSAPDSTDTPVTTAGQQGMYELRVTIDATSCFALDTVVVREDLAAPNAMVPGVSALNCTVRQRTLTAAPPAAGITYDPVWRTDNGNIVGPTDGASIVVDAPGDYRLLLVNPANGCVDSTAVAVAQDTVAPNANIGIAPTLTCRNMTVQLDGRFSSSGPDFTYQWTTSNGSIASGSNTLRPTVSAAGNYLLTVTNQRNNCTGSAAVLVEQLDQPPVLTATEPETLTCRTTSVALLARRTGSGETFSISWATTDGNILSGSNGLSPIVDQPGTYSLTVINTDTECQTTLPVVVMQDITPPIVDLGQDFDLGCEDVPVLLSSSVTGPAPYDYSWATTDGNILSGGSSGTPQVQGPGTYAVTVTSKRNGCPATAEITTTQSLLLGFEAGQRDPTCRQPLGRVEITSVDGGTAPFLYAVGNGGFTTTAIADSLMPGRYNVVVQDANGCEVNSEVIIPNTPELDLYVDPRAVITLGDSYFINTQINFADSSLAQITWFPALDLDCTDCLRPTATPTVSSVYTVNVVSTDGCAASGSVEIIVDVLREVYFPTAFSPTGDGINDRFLPFGNPTRIARVLDFSIFDRWGESVFNNTDFQPNDPAEGWDGMLSGQPLNPAVFVYTAVVEFVDGRVETFKGDVVLIR